MKKALLSVACLSTIAVFAQEKDSLKVKKCR